MVVIGQRACIRARWFCSCKCVVFGRRGCNRAKVVVFGQKWLYKGKGGCIRAKVVVLRQ